jgi:phosphatidylserine/phosphatidylglycerophosphate/cardiolipin synthase-like enzyme
MTEYKQDLERKRQERKRESQELRDQLEDDHGLKDHPKAQILWQLAWDRGNSFGFQFVREYYEEMAQLLKP